MAADKEQNKIEQNYKKAATEFMESRISAAEQKAKLDAQTAANFDAFNKYYGIIPMGQPNQPGQPTGQNQQGGNPIAAASSTIKGTGSLPQQSQIRQLPPNVDVSFDSDGKERVSYKSPAQKQDAISQLGIDTEGKDIEQIRKDIQKKNPSLYSYLEKVGKNELPVRGAVGMAYNQVSEIVSSLFGETYDPTVYEARAALRKSYTSGKVSEKLISINTALHHADLAYDQANKLNNGKIKAVNNFGNFLRTQTSDPDLARFKTTLSFLNRETPKAIAAGIVTNEDKQSFDNNLNAAQSKEQAMGVIDDYIQLLGGRVQPYIENWEDTMGDLKKFPVMYKSTIPILNKHGFAYDKDTGAITKEEDQVGSQGDLQQRTQKAQQANQLVQQNPQNKGESDSDYKKRIIGMIGNQ
jgi:hypothetical protein